MIKRRKWINFLIFLSVFMLVGAFSTTIESEASKETVKTIKVGYYITPGFQEYDEKTGVYSGYGYEYLLALKQYTNWNFEFVQVEFAEAVEMLQDGELDLLNNVSVTDERKEKLLFSKYASGTNYACLVTRSDNAQYAFNDYSKFDGVRVGLRPDSIFNEAFDTLCKEEGFSPQITYYDSYGKIEQALEDGEIDARLVSSSNNMEGKRVIARFSPMDYYFAVPKAETALYEELNDAMENMKEEQPGLEQILEKRYYKNGTNDLVVLSEEEKQYVKEHTSINVACTRSWYPISYFDSEDRYTGPLAEIYRTISAATGLQFTYVPYDNYTLALQAFQSGETDMICEMPQDVVFADKYDANVTDSVASVGIYRVSKGNINTEDIHKVAILKGTYIGHLASEAYKDTGAEMLALSTTDECINAVNDGEADCAFMNSYQSYYYQSQGKYLQLKYVLIPEMQYNISLAANRTEDGMILKSILAKGLATMNEDSINELFQNIQEEGQVKQDLEVLFYRNPILVILGCILVAIILVIVVAFIIYSLKMRHKNAELMAAKQQESAFLSRMSHDIRTPLNGIIGMTQLALADGGNEKEYRDCMKNIDSSGQYLLELVNNILDFKKIESEDLNLKKENYSLNELRNHVFAVIAPLCKQKDITFEMSLFSDITGEIMTDKIRLNQILINLLSNAVKYTPAGGMVSFQSEHTRIEEGLLKTDLYVKDNGIGMSEDFQKHMFDSFTQENTTTAAGGTGLGLSIVWLLVEKMKGSVSVESTQGKGTTVSLHFDFPYTENQEAEKQKMIWPEDFLKGKRFLLCEDHPLNAEIARRMLERKQAVVETAENGQVGVDMFKCSPEGYYDAIFMDIRMPIMNGIEAAETIRGLEHPDASRIPIMAMTADAYDMDRERTKAAGMNAHLSKPVDGQELYRTLEQVLSL